jgi:hypothetical protein
LFDNREKECAFPAPGLKFTGYMAILARRSARTVFQFFVFILLRAVRTCSRSVWGRRAAVNGLPLLNFAASPPIMAAVAFQHCVAGVARDPFVNFPWYAIGQSLRGEVVP